MTIVTYPTPPFTNPPIQPQFYVPNYFVISDITPGLRTLVTTTSTYNFFLGQLVRFLISQDSGTRELNNVTALIDELVSPTEFYVRLELTNSTPFVFDSNSPSYVLAIGDNNSGAINSNRQQQQLFIDGSFRNIS